MWFIHINKLYDVIFYLNSNEITENIGFIIDWIFHLCHRFLATESIKNFASSFESIDNVQSCNSFSFCMFGVGNSITNYIFEKYAKNTSSFFFMVQFHAHRLTDLPTGKILNLAWTKTFINESRNSLDSTSSSQSTNGRFGNTMDTIPQRFSVSLRSPFTQTLTTFSSSWHLFFRMITKSNSGSNFRISPKAGETKLTNQNIVFYMTACWTYSEIMIKGVPVILFALINKIIIKLFSYILSP